MLCAATFSNSYIKWRLHYVMLRFVAVLIYIHRGFLRPWKRRDMLSVAMLPIQSGVKALFR